MKYKQLYFFTKNAFILNETEKSLYSAPQIQKYRKNGRFKLGK